MKRAAPSLLSDSRVPSAFCGVVLELPDAIRRDPRLGERPEARVDPVHPRRVFAPRDDAVDGPARLRHTLPCLRRQGHQARAARDLHDVRAVELPLLRFEVIHNLHGQFRPEIAADERSLQFVPVDVGLGEALEE